MYETPEQSTHGPTSAPDNDFGKVISDFVKDLLNTFPEIATSLDDNLKCIAQGIDISKERLSAVKTFCEKVYPERFFDILYQNDTIFEQEEPLYFLPGVDFRPLWKENISDTTRETIWKYLQLLLFSVVSDLSDSSSFGDTAKLFEAIDEEKFKTKLEETISQMQSCFDMSGATGTDTSGINLEDLPDPESLHDHVTGMMDGKLGSLAREIAEETAGELNVNMEDESSVGDVFQKLLQEPTKLMGLVQKVGGKLDEKIKTGELKESELLAEAGEIMNKMKDMPGMSNLQSMFGGGGGGAKMNVGAMQAQMERNMKSAKQRERMKHKMSNNATSESKPEMNEQEMNAAVAAANEAIASLLRSEGMSDEGIEKLVFSTGETYQKSRPSDAPGTASHGESDNANASSGKKKKKRKKKGKGGK
tara:strand:- start:614 stop:1870 length:1257 start_codon:yes stop_codon:yes gene_type:complete